MSIDIKDEKNDNFWNLDEYITKKRKSKDSAYKVNVTRSTSAVDIDIVAQSNKNEYYSDSKLSTVSQSNTTSNNTSDTITRFIPPHKDEIYSQRILIHEYSPQNPLIKSIRVFSSKKDTSLFPKSNLFIREKYALIDRKAEECQHVSYFSFSPRYSQMSRGQLKWYLWWRENIRNGVYLKTDESYITLYTYELAAADTADEAQKSVAILCSLLNNYSVKDITIVERMMIRDIICDLCIIYALDSPLSIINEYDRTLFFNTFLPEFFIDLYDKIDFNSTKLYITSISMYDYRKSKYYNDETESVFNDSISGVLNEIFKNDRSFNEIMAFSSGKYGCITAERRPFIRMVNIVNRDVKYEIKYYQISNIQSVITDAIRYSENRIREHLGIKNKLHILAVNPILKQVIDTFYDTFYPAKPTIDRRRTSKTINEAEVHEYDRFYDVPKVEISAEHAIEIEQLSWNTTKILTEAFSAEDAQEVKDNSIVALKETECIATNNDSDPIITDHDVIEGSNSTDPLSMLSNNTSNGNETCLFIEIKNKLGKIADFLLLCKNGTALDQRRFSSDNSLSVDEIADEINEVSVDIFGDIILESTDEGYRILDDYKDQIF